MKRKTKIADVIFFAFDLAETIKINTYEYREPK
jgi:hypothetical protein